MKKALVTGAAGFCGHHLVSFLAQRGLSVIGLVHRALPETRIPEIPFIPVDLRDAAALRRVIDREQPDVVYHLAAQTIPLMSWVNESRTLETNTAGTIYLLDALRRHCPKGRLLLASTSQVYGQTFRERRRVKEMAPLQPQTPYAASKVLAEMACLDFYRKFGIDVAIARAFNHFGEGQTGPFVFAQWCRQIASAEAGFGPRLLRVGNLNVQREFLHVDDVVTAYYIIASQAPAGRIYNVCQGRSYFLKECLDYLLSRARVKLQVQVNKKLMRSVDVPHIGGDASELRRLGWRPKKSVFEALDDLLEYWRARICRAERKC